MKWTDLQQSEIDALIKRRLLRERESFERAMQTLQDRHVAELASLQAEIARLTSERDCARRLADKWFRTPDAR